MAVFAHIFKSLFRAFVRIFFTALFCAALAAGVVALVSYEATRQWPPHQLTIFAMVALAVLAGYAGGITVLLSEAVHGAIAAARTVEHDTVGAVETAAGDLHHAVEPAPAPHHEHGGHHD